MYSVYLVDDEALILSDMERSIPWYEHDFQLVGSSTDPKLALHEILDLKPNVVFTDIKMPHMTGFELAQALREKELECEVVIVSAYEQLDYARQVIQLGGFDYLIKPVEEKQYAQLLDRLLRRLEKKYPHRNLPSTQSAELNAIIQHLNGHLQEKASLGQLAKQFNISPNYICSLFSKHLGTTYSAYLTRIRMEHAARLLAGTEAPVKEVAMKSGYEDYFYFCRVFREYHGATPTQFRNGK
jgi:YesN/AraC family two-component response regulator